MLHLEDEETAIPFLSQIGIEVFDLHTTTPLDVGQAVEFHGHVVSTTGGGFDDSNMDNRKPIPKIVDGRIEGRGPKQIFALTKQVLPDGMCGGPVVCRMLHAGRTFTLPSSSSSSIDTDSSSKNNSSHNGVGDRPYSTSPNPQHVTLGLRLCGLLEGIVPPEHAVEALRGRGVFVENQEILE